MEHPSAAPQAPFRPRMLLPAGIALAAAALVGVFWRPLHPVLAFLLPWEFSPTVLAVTLIAAVAYARGWRSARQVGVPAGFWRGLSFYLGLGLIYFMLQSRYDYYGQHMFFMHRLQHLVLHHLGPFLLALAYPGELLLSGMPAWAREQLFRPLQQARLFRGAANVIQHPLVSPVVFVGLLYFWLIPDLHFDAMINADLYKVMNWSMALDGILFWLLMFDPRPKPAARLSYGRRIFILCAIMLPQIALGAVIGLTTTDIYPIYALCGRAYNLDPITDQHLGGLIIWIPACMMSVIGALVVLGMLLRSESRKSAAGPDTLSAEPSAET